MSNTRTVSMTLLLAIAFVGSVGPEHVGEPELIAAGEITVLLWNETDNRQPTQIVRWAIDRYAVAGLVVPGGEVAFHPFQPGLGRCNGFGGYYRAGTGGYHIDMCAVGVPSRRHIVLHEFAHAWAHEHVTGEQRRAFQVEKGLESWNDHADARAERATEHVAETIAWGLDVRCDAKETIADEHFADLAAAFETLTGVPPICRP